MTTFTIRRLHFAPALKFGCLLGPIITTLPSLLFAVLARVWIGTFRDWLEATTIIELPGLLPDLNLINLLNLGDLLARFQALDEAGFLLIIGLTFGFSLFGALFIALASAAWVGLYNALAAATGGLAFTAEVAGLPAPAPPAPAPPAQKPPTELVSPAQAPMLALRHNPQERWLMQARTTIGSAPDNDITLTGLAPHHAEVRREEAGFVLYDLSGGQTWVNDRSFGRANLLKPGYSVRVGHYDLVFNG